MTTTDPTSTDPDPSTVEAAARDAAISAAVAAVEPGPAPQFATALQDPTVQSIMAERRNAVAHRDAEFAAARLRYATLIAFLDGSLFSLGVEFDAAGNIQPAGTNLAAAQAQLAEQEATDAADAAEAAAHEPVPPPANAELSNATAD